MPRWWECSGLRNEVSCLSLRNPEMIICFRGKLSSWKKHYLLSSSVKVLKCLVLKMYSVLSCKGVVSEERPFGEPLWNWASPFHPLSASRLQRSCFPHLEGPLLSTPHSHVLPSPGLRRVEQPPEWTSSAPSALIPQTPGWTGSSCTGS